MTPIERLAGDERRRQIVEAAMPIFAAKGFTATTTREIARAAGVSEALLYRHFPSKEHLYRDLDQLCTPEAVAIGDGLAAQGASTRTLVLATYFITRLIFRGAPGHEEEQAMMKRLLVHSLLGDGDFARTFLEARFLPHVPAMEACLRAAEASGDLVLDTDATRARVLLAHHMPIGAHLFILPARPVAPHAEDDDEILDEAVRFTLRGMGVRPESVAKLFNPKACSEWFEHAFKAATAAATGGNTK